MDKKMTSGGSIRRMAAAVAATVAMTIFVPSAFAANAAPAITQPTNGSVKSGLAPVSVQGTAAANTIVEVFEGIASLGTATAASNGQWAINVALGEGAHTIHAVATGLTSAPVTFDVDSVRPSINIESPGKDEIFGPDRDVTIEGKAFDDRGLFAVRLEFWQLGSMRRAVLAQCACDGVQSDWTYTSEFGAGDWTVKAMSIDNGGNYSLRDSVTFYNAGVKLPFTPPSPEAPGAPDIIPPEILTPSGDDDEVVPGADGPVVIGGSTGGGSEVTIIEDTLGVIGHDVDEDEDGTWKVKVRLPTGEYEIRARATDDEGNVSALSEAITFTVDGERPSVHMITANNKIFLPTEDVVLEGKVKDNFLAARVVLDYYDLDGKLILREAAECSACPAGSARWRHEPNLPLGPNRYTVKVHAFDGAGNAAVQQTITVIKAL